MKEVYREGKIGDEFAAGDEDDNGHGPATHQISITYYLDMKRTGNERGAHMQRAPSKSQTNAISQPCVLSPRTDSQPRSRSTPNGWPATSEVKTMSTSAMA